MPINVWNKTNCWLSCCLFKNRLQPDVIMDALEEQNIESRPIWKPMHMQPFFKKCTCIGGEVAEEIFKTGVCLPSDTKMTEAVQEEIVDIITGLM